MGSPSATRFEFRDFAKVFSLSILLFIFFAGIFNYFPPSVNFMGNVHPTISFLIQYLIQFVILFFPLWLFVYGKYAASLSDFGFQKIPFLKLIKTVGLCYVFYLVISFIITTFLASSNLEMPGYEAQQSYIPLFGDNLPGLIIAILFISIIAPFLEEFFFRGFIYRVFTKTWPVWFGSIATAALFALIHFQINSFIPLFILGLILNYTYQRTNSVWTAVVFHSLNNTIAFGLDIYLYFHPELLHQLEGTIGSIV